MIFIHQMEKPLPPKHFIKMLVKLEHIFCDTERLNTLQN